MTTDNRFDAIRFQSKQRIDARNASCSRKRNSDDKQCHRAHHISKRWKPATNNSPSFSPMFGNCRTAYVESLQSFFWNCFSIKEKFYKHEKMQLLWRHHSIEANCTTIQTLFNNNTMKLSSKRTWCQNKSFVSHSRSENTSSRQRVMRHKCEKICCNNKQQQRLIGAFFVGHQVKTGVPESRISSRSSRTTGRPASPESWSTPCRAVFALCPLHNHIRIE